MDSLEQYYKENINQLIDNINQLIDKKIMPYQNFNIAQIKLIHEDLTSAYYTLGGDYPDEECEDHAIIYGNQLFAKINELIKYLPIDLLDDTLIYINEHRHNFKCSYCS